MKESTAPKTSLGSLEICSCPHGQAKCFLSDKTTIVGLLDFHVVQFHVVFVTPKH